MILTDEDDNGEKSAPSKLSAAGGLGSLMSSYVVDSSDNEGETKDTEGLYSVDLKLRDTEFFSRCS